MVNNNSRPLVSIITPSFNQSSYLEETIVSVINQNYKNIEYIIIDGGSTDGSIDLIKKYDKQLTYWVSEKDNGQADAINKGLLQTTGNYICWINSDDILYQDFISRRIIEFEKNPDIDLIYGDVNQGTDHENMWLRKGKQTSFNKILETLDVPIPQQSAMWRRKVFEKTGILDPQWHVLLDRDYFTKISRNHKILYIPGSLSFFRVHKHSKSIKETIKWVEELPLYYESLIEKWEDYRNQRHLVMAKCYWECSKISLENNELKMGEEFLKKAKKESLITFARLWFIKFLVKMKHKVNLKNKSRC